MNTLLVFLLALSCCSAYVHIVGPPASSNTQGVTYHVADMSRRFGWVISWLSERGPVGQVVANLVVALFVLPPLGPLVCSLLENCDAARATAQNWAYNTLKLNDIRSRSKQEDLILAFELLDAANDKYA